MKAKFTISLIFIFAVSVYLFPGWLINENISVEETSAISASGNIISSTASDEPFLIGALDGGIDTHLVNLNDLGFNAWHKYLTGHFQGWTDNDSLNSHINIYRSDVQGLLNNLESNGMKSIMHRPKIAFLAYGQRSDYQCEFIDTTDALWFYSFQSPDHVGVDINDNWQGETQKVRYCEVNPHSTDGGAGWAVSRLKANTEQCFSWSFVGVGTPLTDWIIKPRIRIDSTFANNPSNWETVVCKIKVIGQNGDTVLKDVDIIVSDFLDQNDFYNGDYLEEFNFTGSINLNITGSWGTIVGAFNAARGNYTNEIDYFNKADIQVYWYGHCDMWIDYVRVDNIVAHDLFRGFYTDPIFNNEWLRWEAQDIACHGNSPAKFYIELFEFSNIPCIAYVNEKLNSFCENEIILTGLFTPTIYAMHVPWAKRFTVLNTDHYLEHFVDKVGAKDIFLPCYPFYAEKQTSYTQSLSKIPNTLPITSGDSVLAQAISPSAYDDWLQYILDHSPAYIEPGYNGQYPYTGNAREWEGYFRSMMKLGDLISKERDIPFWYNAQSHIWYYAEAETHKEPTNEEMEMIANVSLTLLEGS